MMVSEGDSDGNGGNKGAVMVHSDGKRNKDYSDSRRELQL